MTTTTTRDYVELYRLLREAFPDAPAEPNRKPEEREGGGITFVYNQHAWTDESYGWEPESDCPRQVYCWQPVFRPCPTGGRFYHLVSSIGD